MNYLKSRNTIVVGADIFIVQKEMPQLPASLGIFKPVMISNRGNQIWPSLNPPVELVDVFQCRFQTEALDRGCEAADIMNLLQAIEKAGFTWVHVEKLLVTNGKLGFAKADGQS